MVNDNEEKDKMYPHFMKIKCIIKKLYNSNWHDSREQFPKTQLYSKQRK